MNKDRIILTDIYRGPKKFSQVAFRKNSINLRHHTDIFYCYKILLAQFEIICDMNIGHVYIILLTKLKCVKKNDGPRN